MSETHNILVTGNGFDLYHGLNTNYQDFLTAAAEIEKNRKSSKLHGNRKFLLYAVRTVFSDTFKAEWPQIRTGMDLNQNLKKL